MQIKIRFNTNYFKNNKSKKWRLIIDGKENFVNSIVCNQKSKTTKDYIIENGNTIEKFHVKTYSKNVEIENEYAVIHGLLNNSEKVYDVLVSWSMKNSLWKVISQGKEHLVEEVIFICGFYTCERNDKFYLCCNPKNIWFNEDKTKILLK